MRMVLGIHMYLNVLCSPAFNYVENDQDCHDDDNEVYPDAIEICDEIDNNWQWICR